MVFMSTSNADLIKDKIFIVQVIEKGTQNMVAHEVFISRDLQLRCNEKGLKEKVHVELKGALNKILKNPNFDTMVLK